MLALCSSGTTVWQWYGGSDSPVTDDATAPPPPPPPPPAEAAAAAAELVRGDMAPPPEADEVEASVTSVAGDGEVWQAFGGASDAATWCRAYENDDDNDSQDWSTVLCRRAGLTMWFGLPMWSSWEQCSWTRLGMAAAKELGCDAMSLWLPPNVAEWRADHIEVWLASVKDLAHLGPAFRAAKVDSGNLLLLLSDANLEAELGVSDPADREWLRRSLSPAEFPLDLPANLSAWFSYVAARRFLRGLLSSWHLCVGCVGCGMLRGALGLGQGGRPRDTSMKGKLTGGLSSAALPFGLLVILYCALDLVHSLWLVMRAVGRGLGWHVAQIAWTLLAPLAAGSRLFNAGADELAGTGKVLPLWTRWCEHANLRPPSPLFD